LLSGAQELEEAGGGLYEDSSKAEVRREKEALRPREEEGRNDIKAVFHLREEQRSVPSRTPPWYLPEKKEKYIG